MNKSILLISFHNQKALGIRYLEKSLKKFGYSVNLVFFKGFNSINPNEVTPKEIQLLKKIIDDINPGLIGLSVMTSLYLETVYAVNQMIRDNYNIPIVWGGVYASLFPERCLERADFIIRGEGENAIIDLVNAIYNNQSYENIENLAFKKDHETIVNGVRPLCENLDEFGYPEIGGKNKYFIENNEVSYGDPQLKAINYELTASRGCPFICSYCCSVNLHRMYKGKGKYVRFRSVSSVLDELNEAKSKIPRLKVIHFWDEIFSDDPAWIDEFVSRYKKEINLPFEIWAHPLKVKEDLITKLVYAGLYKVVMGIQSGSPRIRKDIFHRNEKQADIIKASKILSDCKVPQVVYDFMIQHDFENEEDIRQTYELCLELKPPFSLAIHGLNYLPGTDIVDMALEMNIADKEELDRLMYSSMQEQYNRWWGSKQENTISEFWCSLIFLTQFHFIQPLTRYFAKRSTSERHTLMAIKVSRLFEPLKKFNHYYQKLGIILRSI